MKILEMKNRPSFSIVCILIAVGFMILIQYLLSAKVEDISYSILFTCLHPVLGQRKGNCLCPLGMENISDLRPSVSCRLVPGVPSGL
jgi:hypothetical protein